MLNVTSENKPPTGDDLLSRVDDKITTAKREIISVLTWRLLFFFAAQVGFTAALVQLLN